MSPGSAGARELYLDDQAVRAAAEADPSAFVRHDGLLMIDKIQRVPELLLAIKREVDRDPRPGRFLLTGSARLLDLRDLPDALLGRTETIELWPLSQGEIDSAADGFVDVLFQLDGNVRMPPCSLTKRDYVARERRRPAAADPLALPGPTRLVFVIKRVPAWSSNPTTRAMSTPKLIVTDSGLGGRLIGMSEEHAKDSVAPVGPLLENFAIGEVARQLTWAEEPVQLSTTVTATRWR